MCFGIYADDASSRSGSRKGTWRRSRHMPWRTSRAWDTRSGTPVQIVVAPKVSPATKNTEVPGHRSRPRRCADLFRHGYRSSTAPVAHPAFGADVLRSVRFQGGAWASSDRSGDVIAFLHGAHASDHHMLAFAKSDGPGHHSSWDVASIDEVGLGMQQMADRGHVHGWGVGRHVIGSNYFRYVRDPGAASPNTVRHRFHPRRRGMECG
jgi:hypothetical protein